MNLPAIEELEDESKYRLILKLQYENLTETVFEYLKKMSGLMILFWSFCIIFAGIAIHIRLGVAGYFPFKMIFVNTIIGLIVLPVLSVPLHELMHVFPFLISGARKLRFGADLRQFLIYVTVHRHVMSSTQYYFVGLIPFVLMSSVILVLIFISPGLWKWSLSLLLVIHATMCAGDFALLNFCYLNRKNKIYTWDDADEKVAYFYQEI
jgi:hypothetical protein